MCGGAAAALMTGVYFHGPLAGGETYDRPATEVYRIVEASPLPALFDRMVYGQQRGSVTRGGEPDRSMVWYFHANGAQVARYTVALYPSGPKTRVSTRFEMTDAARQALRNGVAIQGADQYEAVGRAAMDEQIDARLAGRKFDHARIARAMAGVTTADIGKARGEAPRSIDEAPARFSRRDETRMHRAAPAEIPSDRPGEAMVR